MPKKPSRSELSRRRLAKLVGLAATQGQIVSRTQAYEVGLSRGEVRANIRARRWRGVGSHCLCIHTGSLTAEESRWAAVIEGGPRAYLDGTSALIASGLQRFDEAEIRVSVPKGARIRRRRRPGVNLRETRRWRADDVLPAGVPRVRPAVAAVRGALWAGSDRAAALILTMTVQQGLCLAEDLAVELLRIRRDRRRAFLHAVLLDLLGGVRSLGELDVVQGCRDRGLPEPDAQVMRRTSRGTYFLDFRWKRWGVVVEVDGIQHAWAEQIVGEALRQNSLAISGDTVLRLPLLGLRVCPDDFFGQIVEALKVAGCPLPVGVPA